MSKKLVIDAHCHLFKSFDFFPPVLNDDLEKWMPKEWLDTVSKSGTPEECIKHMDIAGVDMSVVTVWDASVMCDQQPKISIWEQNEYLADAQKRYPNKLIGLVGLDPSRKDAVEIVENGINKLGLKGVKIYCAGCKVTDPRLEPVMKKLNDFGLPVLFHSGTDPLPFEVQYGDPRDLDTLSVKYPRIKIIAGHLARGYEDLLAEVIHYREKQIYQDISGWQDRAQKSKWYFTLYLRQLMDFIPDSVLMGTDWPWERIAPKMGAKEWFDFIRNLKIPKAVEDQGLGIKDFTQEEKDKILGENARKLFGL